MIRLPFVLLLLILLPLAGEAGPFQVRDQNPFLLGFNIPLALPARVATAGETRAATVLNWANSSTAKMAADEALIVDGESRELRLIAEHGLGRKLAVRATLPWIYIGGGVLDGFIDGWHDVFGLPDGARDELPRNQLLIGYLRQGDILYTQREPRQGLGDLALELGYQWLANDHSAIAIWASVELPTGDERELRGNGATDLALAVSGSHTLDRHWAVFGQVGVSLLGEGEFLADQQEDLVFSGMAGVEYGFANGLSLRAQFDAHTRVFDDSRFGYLGDAVLLTVGGDIRFGSGWQLDLAVTEDVVTEHAPDVSLHFALRRSF